MVKLEDFFEKNGLEQVYIKSIDDCKHQLIEFIQKNSPLFNFTDHGINHSNRINERICQLFNALLSNKDSRIRLNNPELYSLILAIYLHDIGMELINKKKILDLFKEKGYRNSFLSYISNLISNEDVERLEENSPEFYDFIRKNHHIISAMWIMSNNKLSNALKLPIRDEYLKTIALICFAHNEDMSILKEDFYNNTQSDNHKIQVGVLSYMLRVGDALDADKSRCNIDILELKDVSITSRIHWYRHFYTNSITCDNKNVMLSFEFPEGSEWSDNIEDYFIKETLYWIKNNTEEIINSKIFEDNIRNNYLKYNVEYKNDYAIKRQLDKETRQEIINIISNKKKIIIKPYINKYIDVYQNKFNESLIQNRYNGAVNKSLQDIFVKPRLYEYSEFERDREENRTKNRLEIDDILKDNNNYIIKGDECIGKTTLLRYLFIKSKEVDKIPFYLSFNDLLYDSNNLIYKLLEKTNNVELNIDLDLALENGNCILLIDNFIGDSKFYKHINEFIKMFPNNRVIMTELEDKYKRLSNIKYKIDNNTPEDCFNRIYLHSFGIRELRNMISKWFKDSDLDEYIIFNKMKEFIFANKLPRTPLVYSLFLSIIEKDSAFIPVNISALFDKFSDIYLGKFYIFPNMHGKYDYQLKAIILEELSKHLIDNNKKHLTIEEYKDFINLFSKEKRRVNADILLDDLIKSSFIEKEEDIIKFSFDCFLFFFYAKYAQRNHKEQLLLDYIDVSKFSSIINFYSGLLTNCENILVSCSVSLMENLVINYENVENYINSYFKSSKLKNAEFIVERKQESDIHKKLDEKEEDEYLIEREFDEFPDNDLSDEKNDIVSALLLLCNVLKNSEYVTNDLKKESLEYCLDCYVWILCRLLEELEIKINKSENSDKLNDNINEFIILFTLVVQDIASATLATTMLEDQIKQLNINPKSILHEFLTCMLAIELEIPNYLELLDVFIKKLDNRILLECTRYKLETVYMERNFSKNNKDKNIIVQLIETILRKIHSKQSSNNRNFVHQLMININNYIENLRNEKIVYEMRQLG